MTKTVRWGPKVLIGTCNWDFSNYLKRNLSSKWVFKIDLLRANLYKNSKICVEAMRVAISLSRKTLITFNITIGALYHLLMQHDVVVRNHMQRLFHMYKAKKIQDFEGKLKKNHPLISFLFKI
jgi:hypothetical protein